MKLGKHTNGISCEYEMQEHFSEFIDGINTWLDSFEWAKFEKYKFVPELNVPQVGRRADFLLLHQNKGLINVEAKCNNFKCMMEQLDDHARYCNYSFAYIPDYSLTPKWFKTELAEKGYGLIVYNHSQKTVTEALEAHQNRKLDNQIRRDVISKIRNAILKKTNYGQIKIEL